MSGMGGLNVRTIKLLLTIIASGLFKCNLQHNLVVRETPKAYYTKFAYVNVLMAERKNSGMVKDNKMLQWAIRMLLAKRLKRQRLNRCGWVLKYACLRYSPFLVGNSKVIKCLLQLESYLYWLLQDSYRSFNHFLIIHNKNEFPYVLPFVIQVILIALKPFETTGFQICFT
jgi:hypothetical protein